MRISCPSEAGLSPSSDSRNAFSTLLAKPLSHTLTDSVRASGTEMVPICDSGVIEP